METLIAHDILSVDTISEGNNRPWDKLIAYMEANITEPTNFDFKGIEMTQPYNSDSFIKLLGNPNFYMTIHNNPRLLDSIKVLLTLSNQDVSKVANIQDAIPKKVSPEQRAIENMAKQLQDYFETDGDVGTLHIYRRFDQIGMPKTVDYIREAMRMYSENTGIKHIILNTSNMSIQSFVTEYVANLVGDMQKIGVSLEIVTDDKEIKSKISMYHGLQNATYSLMDKFNIMKARLALGRVGILTKYKDSRAKDEFGRYGRGEKVQVRVAIFRGFTKKDNNVFAVFETFNGNTFYTASHWSITHDGDIRTKLKSDRVEVPVADLGIYNDFLGPRYHFSTPVQYSNSATEIIYSADAEGRVTGKKMTIPERAKAVFDDYEVSYEVESLNAYIEETRKILSNI